MNNKIISLAALLFLGSAAIYGQTTPPYTQDFYASSDFQLMTLIDGNNDGNTWTHASYDPLTWSAAARYTGSASSPADDWMITPGLELKAGYSYKFSFNAIGVTGYTNNINVMLGSAQTAEALTTPVISPVTLTEKVKNLYSGEITVENDGTYYLGFHVTAEANQGAIYVDDIKIEAGILGAAPAPATALTATAAAENGAAVMKITFTAPDKTNAGTALTEISNIIIYRGTEKIAELGEATPGQTVEYTDPSPQLYNNAYRIICVNAAGEGAEATVNGYLSYNTPAAPSNVVLASTEDGLTITWDAVTTGAYSSGVFIPENVTYTITRSDKVTVATGLKECSFTDSYSNEGEGQVPLSYSVTAKNEGGTSAATASNELLIGSPYTGEYAESFANYSYSTKTWKSEGVWAIKTTSYYSPAISADQDGNNGFIGFSSYTSGTSSRLISPVINVSEMQNPRLSFYLYHAATTYTDRVLPELLINGEYIALADEAITVNSEVEGWTKYNFDLTPEQVAGDFQLSFNATAGGGYLVAIDNITIKDALPYNLAITSITIPNTLSIGKLAEINVDVKNTGVNTAAHYQLKLFCNGVEFANAVDSDLASEQTRSFELGYYPNPFEVDKELTFEAKVVYENDLNADDNSASASALVIGNDLPTPTELTAIYEPDLVTLTWTAPVVPEVEVQPVKTESFEDWTVDSTEPAAGWTFVDRDGKNISGYVGFGSSAPMAFITSNSSSINPLTGSNYLVSPKNSAYYDYRDDWAISPEVVGGQTISFSVCQKGGYGYYGTTFEVCYSATDNNPDSFVAIEKVNDKSSNWTAYSFTLPENAKYFAIHVIDESSSTSDAMAIDDITFQPGSVQLVLTGYNVYRNEQIYTFLNPSLTELNDHNIENSTEPVTYTYAVSAVYESGESMASNIATVTIAPAISITLDITEAKIEVGKTLTLTATVTPETNTDTIVWTSSDDTVASVDQNGVVTALTTGSATITATVGQISATCLLTVVDTASGINQVTTDNGTVTIYDLQGRRVVNPNKGIYIINGKKVVL